MVDGPAVGPDGTRPAAGKHSGYSNTLAVWTLPGTGPPVRTWTIDTPARTVATDFAPAADWIAVTDIESGVAVRSAADGSVTRSADAVWTNYTASVVRVGPAGRPVVGFGGVHLFAMRTPPDEPEVRWIRNDTRKHFTGLAFHPSGRYLLATSNDETVKVYDCDSWQVAKALTWHVGRLRSVAVSPDGLLVAVGSDTGKIVVFDFDL